MECFLSMIKRYAILTNVSPPPIISFNITLNRSLFKQKKNFKRALGDRNDFNCKQNDEQAYRYALTSQINFFLFFFLSFFFFFFFCNDWISIIPEPTIYGFLVLLLSLLHIFFFFYSRNFTVLVNHTENRA